MSGTALSPKTAARAGSPCCREFGSDWYCSGHGLLSQQTTLNGTTMQRSLWPRTAARRRGPPGRRCTNRANCEATTAAFRGGGIPKGDQFRQRGALGPLRQREQGSGGQAEQAAERRLQVRSAGCDCQIELPFSDGLDHQVFQVSCHGRDQASHHFLLAVAQDFNV